MQRKQKGRRGGVFVLCLVGLALVSLRNRAAAAETPSPESPVPNIRIGDPFAELAVRQSVAAASRRLAGRECQALLSELTDVAGRPLQATLEASGFSAETYLDYMRFYDGTVHPRCRQNGIYAVTLAPGSRFVYVCPARFLDTFRKNAGLAEAYLIHEMLHSLGLGENPPTSQEITDRVVDRCRR